MVERNLCLQKEGVNLFLRLQYLNSKIAKCVKVSKSQPVGGSQAD